jgi:hypothetical protein
MRLIWNRKRALLIAGQDTLLAFSGPVFDKKLYVSGFLCNYKIRENEF